MATEAFRNSPVLTLQYKAAIAIGCFLLPEDGLDFCRVASVRQTT